MNHAQATLDIFFGRGTQAQKDVALEKLARKASDAVRNRVECPECGHKGPHDDNGRTGDELSYCCCSCGTHFDSV
jgi:DNA-directed RNA polymerase subunit RPC12/RpoP